jgi:hypothetical protein
VRRHAKASPAGSILGTGNSRVRFGRAFATRGGSGDANGSGAPSRRPAGALVGLLAVFALLALAPAAQAARGVYNVFGSTGLGGGAFSQRGAELTFVNVSSNVTVGGVAINSTGNGSGASAGDLYAVDRGNNRIEQFSATGKFIRAWGYDVVASGQHNSSANEGQTVTVPGTVTGGTFTLTVTTAIGEGRMERDEPFAFGVSHMTTIKEVVTFPGQIRVGDSLTSDEEGISRTSLVTAVNGDTVIRVPPGTNGGAGRSSLVATEKTAAIPFNAPASGPGSVQEALEALPGIGSGDVTVTGGPGATAPYLVSFDGGPFAGNDVRPMVATSALTGGSATVATTIAGGGFEACEATSSPTDVCKPGVPSPDAGAMSSPQGVAIEQATGNVYVTDQGNRRVDVFGASGTFQGAFGWGVDTGAAAFQFCTTASICQTPAAAGGAAGQFGTTMGYPGMAPTGAPNAGNLLVADSANNRIDEFTPTLTAGVVTGASFARAFGWDTIPVGGTGDTGAGLEVCTAASTCKGAVAGGGAGQFSSGGAASVAVDASGAIYALNLPPATSCSATARCAVQKFTPAATSATDFAPGQLTFTSGQLAAQAVTALAVDTGDGDVYVSKAAALDVSQEYRVFGFDASGVATETLLSGVGVAQPGEADAEVAFVKAIGIDPSAHRLLFTEANGRNQRLGIIAETPASVGATFSAGLGDPAVTDITTAGATLHATVNPGQGIPLHTVYEFEYTNGSNWIKFPAAPVDLGNGSGSGAPGTCPVNDPPACEIELPISLEPGQRYKVRLHAYVEYNPQVEVTTPYVKFTTLGVVPVAETGQAWWSSPADTTPNLMLTGFVTPKNEVTSFYFQYVDAAAFQQSGYENASVFPEPPGDPAAKSFNRVEVQQPLYELDATKTYHYRLVAVNPTGTSFGGDQTISPPDPAERFNELVSNGDSSAQGIYNGRVNAISDSGDLALFEVLSMDDQKATNGISTPQVAERTNQGWRATAMVADAEHSLGGIAAEYAISDSLTEVLFESMNERERLTGRRQISIGKIDGSERIASPVFQPIATEPGITLGRGTVTTPGPNNREVTLMGYSSDLSTFAIKAQDFAPNGELGGVTLLPNEPLIPRVNLLEVHADTQEVELVNVDSSGNPIGGVCGALLGAKRGHVTGTADSAISDDGSVTYFAARPGVPYSGPCSAAVEAEFGSRIFKRENGETTTEVSRSQCNRPALPAPPGPCSTADGDDVYRGASEDGSTVFFSSPRQLTDSDVDTAPDLYVYDSTPPPGQPTLAQVTAGEVTAGHPTIGSSSGFLGVVATSADGSRVYFTATGRIAAGAPESFSGSIYVYERDAAHPAGRIAHVGKLGFLGDEGLTGFVAEAFAVPTGITDSEGARTYGDGRFLFFTTASHISPNDTDSELGIKDLYRYDDQSGQVVCLSCVGNGEVSAAISNRQGFGKYRNSAQNQAGRMATEDGSRAVFATTESLVPADENSVNDAYEWHEGELTLISAKTGEIGTLSTPKISVEGRDVYFTTDARLVPSDVDTDAASDIYDARIGGGFPAPKPAARICVDGEVCRGETTSAPAIPGNASTSFNGPGNPAVSKPKPKKCAKGKVRRHGKCVKKPKKGAGKHQGKAHGKPRGSK